jgi:hypothetical protein
LLSFPTALFVPATLVAIPIAHVVAVTIALFLAIALSIAITTTLATLTIALFVARQPSPSFLLLSLLLPLLLPLQLPSLLPATLRHGLQGVGGRGGAITKASDGIILCSLIIQDTVRGTILWGAMGQVSLTPPVAK